MASSRIISHEPITQQIPGRSFWKDFPIRQRPMSVHVTESNRLIRGKGLSPEIIFLSILFSSSLASASWLLRLPGKKWWWWVPAPWEPWPRCTLHPVAMKSKYMSCVEVRSSSIRYDSDVFPSVMPTRPERKREKRERSMHGICMYRPAVQ